MSNCTHPEIHEDQDHICLYCVFEAQEQVTKERDEAVELLRRGRVGAVCGFTSTSQLMAWDGDVGAFLARIDAKEAK